MTTPLEAFNSGGYNAKIGLYVRDWYGVGSDFMPQPIQHNGDVIVAARSLICSDVASCFVMDFELLPKQTDATKAEEVITLLRRVFAQHGKPHKGVIVSHSAWVSSSAMAVDIDMRDRGQFLRSVGVEFPEMAQEEKSAIQEWIREQGLQCEFDADRVF